LPECWREPKLVCFVDTLLFHIQLFCLIGAKAAMVWIFRHPIG
jgi:hypothetical protein